MVELVDTNKHLGMKPHPRSGSE